jgi:predicted nucleic acid-binding protein
MQVIVSDANVLIDIEHGDLIEPMFSLLTTFVVPDVLFDKELKERHAHFLHFGLQVKTLSEQALNNVLVFAKKYRQPSRVDLLALGLAMQENCPLLTGDKNLRKAANAEGIAVYGTLWLVSEMVNNKIIQITKAQTAFQNMKKGGSRLPWGEVDKLFKF